METFGLRFSHNILEECSLFLHVATPDEIEAERQLMEARHKQVIKVFEIETTTRSGARCTRVTWETV